jgi:hypothetical protein
VRVPTITATTAAIAAGIVSSDTASASTARNGTSSSAALPRLGSPRAAREALARPPVPSRSGAIHSSGTTIPTATTAGRAARSSRHSHSP